MLGIFDSGIGGLTVARAIHQQAPGTAFLYLGDTARLPYGTKSPSTIERYALSALAFLKRGGATHPVIACHTVSSILLTRPGMRKKVAKMFDSSEIFEMVTPGVETARRATRRGRIGVLGTAATIRSGAYPHALRGFRLTQVAASVLVPLAEEGWSKKAEILPLLKEVLKPFRQRRVDTVILACTHFPILRARIRAILGPTIRLVDPGEELARVLAEHPVPFARGSRRFFATDIPKDFADRASRFWGRRIRTEPVDLA